MTDIPENPATEIELKAPKKPFMAGTRALASGSWNIYVNYIDPALKAASSYIDIARLYVKRTLPFKDFRESGTISLGWNLIRLAALPLLAYSAIRWNQDTDKLSEDIKTRESELSLQSSKNEFLERLNSAIGYVALEYQGDGGKSTIYYPSDLLKDIDKTFPAFVMEPFYFSQISISGRTILTDVSNSDSAATRIAKEVLAPVVKKANPNIDNQASYEEPAKAGSPSATLTGAKTIEEAIKQTEKPKEPLVATPIEDKVAVAIPFGIAISGKIGFCKSPYDPEGADIDVRGREEGTEQKCPKTGKIFLVPEIELPSTQVQAGGNTELPIRKVITVEQ